MSLSNIERGTFQVAKLILNLLNTLNLLKITQCHLNTVLNQVIINQIILIIKQVIINQIILIINKFIINNKFICI